MALLAPPIPPALNSELCTKKWSGRTIESETFVPFIGDQIYVNKIHTSRVSKFRGGFFP